MQDTLIPFGEDDDSSRSLGERLDSWKEVASFFRRQVRTVQLWEKDEGLPVHRQHHKKQGSVYAYRHELEAWWVARSTIASASGRSQVAHGPPAKGKSIEVVVQRPDSSGGMRILALPFEVMRSAADNEPEQQFVEQFARGLQNDLVLELTRSEFHPVILPINAIPSQASSALAWANEIVTELEVDAILTGVIRHSDRQVRISIQMIRASDLLCLWSDRFDAELDDTFDTQAESARRICLALPDCQAHCTKANKHGLNANRSLASQACSMGFHSWQQRGSLALRKAVHYFNDAIELDPRCAEAYAGLADTYISLSYSHLMPARQGASRAWKAAQTALHLSANSIKVKNAYINTLIHCTWNLQTAEQICREMIDAGRFDARTMQLYSSIMILRNRHQDSIRLALRACELAQEPDQIHFNGQVSLAYFYSGDYDNAVSFMRRMIERQPQYMMGYILLGRAEAQRGNWDEAISAFTKGNELSPGSNFNKALLAYAYAGSGEMSLAGSMLKKLSAERDKENFPAYDVSAAYAALNQEQEALDYIRTAFDRRDMMTLFIGQDPRFFGLQNSSRFRQLASSIQADGVLSVAP